MAGSDLGMSVVMTANLDKLTSGLTAAGGKLSSWAVATGAEINRELGEGITKGLKAAAAAATATIAVGGSQVFDKLSELTDIGIVGKQFGLTAKEATGLFQVFKASGSDVRDAQEGLITFNTRIQEALSGSSDVATKLFQDLRVGAEQFVNLNTSERFIKLHESLRNIQDPAERVSALLRAMGEDTGKNLTKILALTTDGLNKEIDALGLSADKLAEVTAAQNALNEAKKSYNKILTDVTVESSPYIDALSNIGSIMGTTDESSRKWGQTLGEIGSVFSFINPLFSDGQERVQSWGSTAEMAIEHVVIAGGYLVDFFEGATGVARVFGGYITSFFGGLLQIVPRLGGLSDWVDDFGMKVQNAGNKMLMVGADNIDNFGSTAEAWEKNFQEWRQKRKQKIDQLKADDARATPREAGAAAMGVAGAFAPLAAAVTPSKEDKERAKKAKQDQDREDNELFREAERSWKEKERERERAAKDKAKDRDEALRTGATVQGVLKGSREADDIEARFLGNRTVDDSKKIAQQHLETSKKVVTGINVLINTVKATTGFGAI